jgi:ectonucleotide pyrophosphatase/phosphodiesterase family protein 5
MRPISFKHSLLLLVMMSCSPLISAADLPIKKPLTLLIGIDGFKPEYLHRGLTPTLNSLAQQGVVAEGLISAFPSVTFPNHYTLVTGLTPDHHGIVNNRMFDSQIPDQVFHYSSIDSIKNPEWWKEGTPIWVTAKQQGKKTSTLFWPGSEALNQGLQPDDWLPYDHGMSSMQRVQKLLTWLDRNDKTRADFATLYLSEVDSIGHKKGPNSVELNNALVNVDNAIKALLTGLDKLDLRTVTSLVIVSDHGMAEVADGHVINGRSLIKAFPGAKIRWTGAFAGIEAKVEDADAILDSLSSQAHLSCWPKQQLPKRFKFGQHRRIPTIFCLAEQGWFVTKSGVKSPVNGMHGYDPNLKDMQGLFIASGYRIKQQDKLLDIFDNVDIYPLLVELLGIKGELNDGNSHLLELLN